MGKTADSGTKEANVEKQAGLIADWSLSGAAGRLVDYCTIIQARSHNISGPSEFHYIDRHLICATYTMLLGVLMWYSYSAADYEISALERGSSHSASPAAVRGLESCLGRIPYNMI